MSLLHFCHGSVTVVLRWCYGSVTAVLRWCYGDVTVHFADFVRQRRPKDVPKGIILRSLGGMGGNVTTMVRAHKTIVLRPGGNPERALAQHFARNIFQHASRNDFFPIFCQFAK